MLAMADPDLDNGPRTDKSATVRMCAVSREVRPIDELIRFVVSPAGRGRSRSSSASFRAGACGLPRRARRLRKRSGVTNSAKGFKRDVRVAPTLAADTETLLARSARRGAGDGRQGRPGRSGFAKVEAALRTANGRASRP